MCWWRRKQTSPRGAGAAALGALAIFRSLPALQQKQHCTQIRHLQQQGRRYCIPSQYRRAGMTPPRPANRKRRTMHLIEANDDAPKTLKVSSSISNKESSKVSKAKQNTESKERAVHRFDIDGNCKMPLKELLQQHNKLHSVVCMRMVRR